MILEIKMKGLMRCYAMPWHAMKSDQKRLRIQNSSKHFEVE